MPATGSAAIELGARGREQPGELAGTRREVDHLATRTDAEVLDEPGHRVGRVRRPGRLVIGRVAEPGCRDLVNHAAIIARTARWPT